jgi:hypothetical protein
VGRVLALVHLGLSLLAGLFGAAVAPFLGLGGRPGAMWGAGFLAIAAVFLVVGALRGRPMPKRVGVVLQAVAALLLLAADAMAGAALSAILFAMGVAVVVRKPAPPQP